jgi:putative ABC transport system substrate-binding protein
VTAFDRALEDELRQLGYTGGQNVTFEYRYSGWTPEQLPELANSLVRANVDVIVAGTNPAIAAAKQATNAIPIVMGLGTAPVQAGFVKSLGQPGGNITGLTSDPTLEILGKELQLLKEATPKLSRVAVVWNSSVPAYAEFFQALVSASRQAGVVLQSVPVERPEGFPPAFADIIRQRAGAVFVFADALTFGHRQQLADFANGRRLPMSGYMREFAEAGCLLSYGPNLVAIYRSAATYIDKIL